MCGYPGEKVLKSYLLGIQCIPIYAMDAGCPNGLTGNCLK